jgi:pimeloyl-ACP methyl ester carboxylesterase
LYDTARAYFPTSRIVIYGKSLGTGIAAHTARDRAWFKSLILEAPYYSITDVGGKHYPYIPVSLLSRYPISTYQYLKDIQHPTYVIHGTADEVIPIESPRQFLKQGYRQFNFIEIPGARHGNLADYKEYDEVFDKALN